MDIVKKASSDADTYEDTSLPHIGFTPSVLPEAKPQIIGECSQTGVTTENVPLSTEEPYKNYCSQRNLNTARQANKIVLQPHWYALRTTYGREKKAYDYIISHNGTAFLPTITIEKIIGGEKQQVVVSRIPNIFFVYGTERDIKSFVYDNVNLPFLRFYYKYTHIGSHRTKTPLIVPDDQIRTLQIICAQESTHDVIVLSEEVPKFKAGEKVRVTQGPFAGVEGFVARFHGQQRVGIVINGLLTAITAYIPGAFLVRIDE